MAGKAQDVFENAVNLSGAEREAYLRGACGQDQSLRNEVDSLFRAYERGAGFLATPTVARGGNSGAATMAAPLREGPGTRIGPFKLLQLIGEGGFGSVFMAEQEKPVARKVALKIIKLGMDTRQVVARFEAERQALAILDHPNIARVFDAGATETGRPYFVMELCKGETIVEYSDKNSLSINDRLELFAQVCQAVQHAHTKGIIHRDIKPSNVLVSTQDGRPHAKVIDFGIAKATASKLTEKTLFTEHKALIGTPEYMSPEQAEGSLDIDTRTDVYSLGVLLYELLTGTTPFTSGELRSAAYAEIQRIIREVEPPKPSTRLSHNTDSIASVAAQRHTEPKKLGAIVRGELDWIVMKALEKDRQRRYETANGLALDIRRYLAGEAVVAAPPSTAYRFKKFVRRNRAQVAATGFIALALLLGLAGTTWQAKVASHRAVAATKAEGEAKTARDAEKTRADELKQVSDFQEKMLAQVDATAAGVRLTEDVNRRLAAALEKDMVPEAERAGIADAFRRTWARVNATDSAAALIDETILRPAVKAIDEQFKDQPVVDAQLRSTLARVYIDLGLYDAAMPLLERALEVRRRVLGEEHPDTLPSISDMGTVLRYRGKRVEAEALFREALEKERRVLGEENPQTLTAINNMGTVLFDQRQYSEAEPYFREALDKGRRVLGEEHPSTLDFINDMGSVLQFQGRRTDAEPYFLEAVEKARRVLGQQHRRTLAYLNNLGILQSQLGQRAKAESSFRETLEKRRLVLGEEHPETLSSIHNLAGLVRIQGKVTEAEALFREAVEKYRRVLGPGHPETLYVMNKLGNLFQGLGRFAEAEPIYREILERSRPLGLQDPKTLEFMANYGTLLSVQGRPAEAEAVLAEGLAVCERAFSTPQPQTALLLHHHADMLRALGRLGEAESEARRAVDLYRAHPEWSPPEAAHADTILGLVRVAVLKSQGKLAEALVIQREAVSALRKAARPDSPELAGFLSTLGLDLLTYGTLEAANEAEPLLRESLEIRVKTTPRDWRVSNTRSLLGGALLAMVELDPSLTPAERAEGMREAEPLLLDGYDKIKDNPAVPKPTPAGGDRRREALERIARLYEVWDKVEPGKGYNAKAAEWKIKLDAAPLAPDKK